MNTTTMNPKTIEELHNLPLGAAVFDMNDAINHLGCAVTRMYVPIGVYERLTNDIPNKVNKIAYKVGTNNSVSVLAYKYDWSCFLINMEY